MHVNEKFNSRRRLLFRKGSFSDAGRDFSFACRRCMQLQETAVVDMGRDQLIRRRHLQVRLERMLVRSLIGQRQ